jgi:coenzyme F420-0:L-glutamate ligase/coenzyme F420-1:gamma-L-glutamate ligase
MQILPIATDLIKEGDDLASLLYEDLQDGDIVVVSSKAVATVEGAAIELSSLEISDEAREWSEKFGRSPEIRQAILNETKRMHGKLCPSKTDILLTELKPDGLEQGTIFVPNAGLDESNIEDGYAIGWPKDPVSSAQNLRDALKEKGKDVAIIISDSGCRPRRIGVTAFALTVAGIDPLQSLVGTEDLFGKSLRVTKEAVADQLATAANIIMGNGGASIPAAIIRDHGFRLSEANMWVPGIDHDKDMFLGTV